MQALRSEAKVRDLHRTIPVLGKAGSAGNDGGPTVSVPLICVADQP